LALAPFAFATGCAVDSNETDTDATARGENALMKGSDLIGEPVEIAEPAEKIKIIKDKTGLGNLDDLKIALPPEKTLEGSIGRLATAKLEAASAGSLRFVLRGNDGKLQDVVLSAAVVKSAGGLLKLTGSRVMLKGYESGGKFVATGIQVNSVPPAQPYIGTKRWLTVLCSFSDLPFPAGETPAYFNSLYGNTYPGLSDYWSKASNGALSIDASTVTDWLPLPLPASHYQAQQPEVRIANLANDCLVNSAIAGLDYTAFDGVSLAFSHNLDQQLIAGPVSLDGVRNYAFAMLSPATFRDQATVARAMGMGMDLTVSGIAPLKFDSEWDLMSGGGMCRTLHPIHGCISVLPAAEHSAKAGWLSPSQISGGGSGTTTVGLDFVGSPAGHQSLIRIPIDSTHYYTIEARNDQSPSLYDREIPRTGVIIHKMNTAAVPDDSPTQTQILDATTRLRFVDNNANNDANDVGSEFGAGAVFSDPAAKLQLSISAKRSYGYDITILRAPTLSVSNNPDAFVSVGSDIRCGAGESACSATFAPNASVTLTANPVEGKRVKSWSGCTVQTNKTKCVVTMNASRSVSVTVERDPSYRPPCECLPSWPVYKCEQICGDDFGGGGHRPGDDGNPRQIP
jgi:hypothetical protein